MNTQTFSNVISLIVSLIIAYFLSNIFMSGTLVVTTPYMIAFGFITALVSGFAFKASQVFCLLLSCIPIKPITQPFIKIANKIRKKKK